MRYRINTYDQAYLLPATIMLGLAIAIIGGVFLRYTGISSQVLNQQNYNAIAEEAARSGLAFANSCLSQGKSWTVPTPKTLAPNTDCTGGSSAGSAYVTVNGTEWRSKFSVSAVNAQNIIASTGTVEVTNSTGTTTLATYEKKLNMSLASGYDEKDPSTGQSITDIKNDRTDCAIANGKLYCWGDNGSGQVGDGTYGPFTDKSVPILVQGALSGKTVTKVSVADTSICAIADGNPYCWGSNDHGQLGQGNIFSLVTPPSADSPTISSGPLKNKKILDIGTASNNLPSLLSPASRAKPHSCAVTEDGVMSCWGSNGFRQLGSIACAGVVLGSNWNVCIGAYNYPDNPYPAYVPGYKFPYANSPLPFAGKRAIRVGASSHDSCLVAEGRMYCMGVEVPLDLSCNSLLFYEANLAGFTINPCTSLYSPGYNMSAKYNFFDNYSMNGKFIDPKTWEVSTNIGCMMADTDFVCVGNGPAVGIRWTGSWNAPWREIKDADVTSHDNGVDPDSSDFSGIYCAIDKGVVKCNGTDWEGGGAAATNVLDLAAIDARAFAGKAPTKVAAGKKHGCVVANGQLFCWGDSSHGVLADNSFGGTNRVVAALSGMSGADGTKIGTDEGTLAASGEISTGGSHSCAAANGKIFCWGDNTYGQLGIGTASPRGKPQQINDGMIPAGYNSVSKISAGANHTCAIVYGRLYCWGRNNNGQLGIGTTDDAKTPQQVGASPGDLLYGKRISDVSTGENGTCAIANGQAYCWGDNSKGQLGSTTAGSSSMTPVLVDAAAGTTAATKAINKIVGKAVTSISTGSTHACAVASSDLYCWGDNANGRTGLGTTSGTSLPTRVTGGTAGSPIFKTDSGFPLWTIYSESLSPLVTSVSAGYDYTCAIINSKISCFGNDLDGRTGRGLTGSTNTLLPTSITGPAAAYYATTISTGYDHACALMYGNSSKVNGNMYCWGKGSAEGQLGYGDALTRSSVSTAIIGGDMNEMTRTGYELRSATNISAGSSSSCAIANAVILCWGNNTRGQLGTGDTTPYKAPKETDKYQVLSSSYALGPIF